MSAHSVYSSRQSEQIVHSLEKHGFCFLRIPPTAMESSVGVPSLSEGSRRDQSIPQSIQSLYDAAEAALRPPAASGPSGPCHVDHNLPYCGFSHDRRLQKSSLWLYAPLWNGERGELWPSVLATEDTPVWPTEGAFVVHRTLDRMAAEVTQEILRRRLGPDSTVAERLYSDGDAADQIGGDAAEFPRSTIPRKRPREADTSDSTEAEAGQTRSRGPAAGKCPLFSAHRSFELLEGRQLEPSALAVFRYDGCPAASAAPAGAPDARGAEAGGHAVVGADHAGGPRGVSVARNEGGILCADHTDYTLLTLIPQHQVAGLEVLDLADFSWKDVLSLVETTETGEIGDPAPDLAGVPETQWVLCMVGELLGAICGFMPTQHRVVQRSCETRLSCALFHYPRLRGRLPCDSVVEEWLADRYLPSVNFG